MKKFLSLVLALVMTMSLVTISAGAKDFTDAEKVNYDEAIAVISEIGVVDGYADGSFNPQATLTRGAAAKIICNLILGPTTASELSADTAPYKDVPTTNTFAGYIAYCAKEGIISGYADGTFRPAGTLTGYAFMKMLLGALGYDAEVEGYTGANWSINVAKQAINIGLNKSLVGEFNGIKPVTREEACLYAFNALQADLVEYDTKTNISVGGAAVVIAGSEAKAQRWNNSATKIENIKKDNYIQFAEQYFTKLKLDETTDAFGRPARKWSWKGTEIGTGTYVNHDLLVATYTQEVTGKDLYDLLGKTAIEDYELSVYIDGIDDATVDANVFGASKMAKTYKLGVGATGDGVLTEVYVDSDAKEITIAIINTYLAKTGDYNSKKDTLPLTIYGVDEVDAKGNLVKKTGDSDAITAGKQPFTEGRVLDGEDFDIEGYKDGDIVLVNVAAGAVEVIADPETVDDVEINAFKKGSYVSVSGDQYDYADTALYDPEVLDQYDDNNMKNATYKLFLDPYGYMIGIKLVTADDTYVFITGYDRPTSNLYNKTADAAAIFLDGTMKTIKVEADATILSTNNGEPCHNTWYTYTVDKNDVYSLKAIPSDGSAKISQFANPTLNGAEINKNQVSLGVYGRKFAYGNDDTVYLTASIKGINATNTGDVVIIDDVDSVTTGVKNVSITTIGADEAAKAEYGANTNLTYANAPAKVSGGVYTLYNTNTGYVVAAVVVGEDDAVTSNYAYVIGSVNREAYDKAEDEYTWNRDVVIDGEKVTLQEKGSHLSANGINSMSNYNWYKVSYKADGTVKKVDAVTPGVTNNTYEYFSIFNGQVTSVKKDAIIVANPVHATTSYKVQLKGYTLHIDPALGWDTGIDVLPECKAVVLEQIDGSVKVEYFDGASNNVRNAVDFLHANPFEGYVYAVMKDGLASTIIFDTTGTNQQSQIGGQPSGKITSATITKSGSNLVALWNDDGSYSGKTVVVDFFLADGSKVYLKDTATGAMSGSTTHSQISSTAIAQNGDYYAVITVKNADGTVAASATTSTVGFAF